ncbi:hypothetical protein KDL01_25945, partial [Actinospica durhamensis]
MELALASDRNDLDLPDRSVEGVREQRATHSTAGAQEVVEGYSADYPTVLTLRDVHVDATATVSQ